MEKKECKVVGCIYPAFRRGLCAKHYSEDRAKSGPRCSVEGCENPVHSGGMCNKHYRRELQKTKPECSVSGCERLQHTAGLCTTHHKRLRSRGNLDPQRPHDWGGKSAHPLYKIWTWHRRHGNFGKCWNDDFWAFADTVGDKPTPNSRLCRLDSTNPFAPENFEWRNPDISIKNAKSKKEYMRKWQKAYREKEPERYRGYEFKRNFGITSCDYNAMFVEQGGVCKICGCGETAIKPVTQEPRNLAVDHCHTTGKIRGLLCTNCNTGLGLMKDDIKILESAINYLQNSKD